MTTPQAIVTSQPVLPFDWESFTRSAKCGRTKRITDPAPVTTDCQPRCSRGVQCIRLVRLHGLPLDVSVTISILH